RPLQGTPSPLDTSLPPVRGLATRTRSAPEMAAVPEAEMKEVDALVERLREERRSPVRTREQELAAARLEALALADYLGEAPRAVRGGRAVGPAPIVVRYVRRSRPAPRLAVEVVWGDISKVEGNVYVVGQYAGVLPQAAVAALDAAISAGSTRRVLADQIRRGLIRGGLGDVEFFPWRAGRVVALAGMGHPGTFGESQLRPLARNRTWSLSTLPASRTVCSVLIGSGAGNLTTHAALRGLLAGLGDALGEEGFSSAIRRLRLVEIGYERAREVHERLEAMREGPALASRLQVALAPRGIPGPGRGAARGDAFALAIGAAADAARGGAAARRPLLAVMRRLPREKPIPERVLEELAKLKPAAALRLRIHEDRDRGAADSVIPT